MCLGVRQGTGANAVTHLVLILGDQLTPTLSSLAGADPARTVVLIAEVTAEAQPLKALAKARTLLLDPARVNDATVPEVREAGLQALRLIEAQVYSELHLARYKQLDSVLFGALDAIRATHKQACTCRD